MDAIQRRRSLILVAIMMLAAVVPSISPYDIEDPILEDEEPIMETGTGPEMAFNLNQAMSIGSSNIDRVHDMASGPNGSAYFIGEWQGTISFGGQNLTSSGSYFDVFVAKMGNNGQWLWVAKISGSSTDRGYGIAVDSSGNAYVTGSCYGTCYFSGGGAIQGNISSLGSADLYVAMIKNNGQWDWMASAGTSGGSESGIDIAVDASGNSYVTGYILNGTVFKDATGNGSITVYTENGKDILAAKLDNYGNWKWVKTAGGMGDDTGASIDIDSSGDAYITGYFTNNSAFGYNLTLSQFSSEEMFVAKVSESATSGQVGWDWAVPFTGSGTTKGTSISVKNGNVFATGIFTSNITVGTTNHGVSSGTTATAVTKLNQSNGQILWYNSAFGSNVQAKDLLISDTEIILTGNHKSTSYFGNYDIIGSSSANDGFIAALNPSNGTWNWSQRIESGSGDVQMNNIEMGPDGSLAVAGYFTGTINLLGTNFSAPNNNHDIFLATIIYAKEGCYVDGTNYNNASQWSICSGGSSSVLISDVTTDSAGNFYMTGIFQGTAIIWGEILVSSGNNDIFVAKLSSSGSWQWVVKAGGLNMDDAYGIAVDSNGNAYVTGFFQETATFGSTSLTSSGGFDIFIAKLSSSGSWQWAVKAGGSSYDAGNGIAVDSSGNAYATGYFQGTAVSFGSTNLTSSGVEDIFIAKLSSSGSWQWAVKAGGSSNDYGYGVAVDTSGNAYATGSFRGTATFGSTSLTISGSYDTFIAKLSSSGSWQWAVKAGGSSGDRGNGIAVDSSGNAYATGSFSGTATFGSTSLTSSGNSIDIFIAKLNNSGSWQWAVKAGGSSNNDYGGNGIAVDSNGDAYATGSFQGTATFGSTSLTSSGNSIDIFIAKLSSSGSWQWAVKAGGSGNDHGNGIAVDSSGNPYVTGYLGYGIATFGLQSLSCPTLNALCGFLWKVDTPAPPSPDGTVAAWLGWNSSTSELEGSFLVTNLVTGYDYGVVYQLHYTSNNTLIGNNTESWSASTNSYGPSLDYWDMQVDNLNYGEQYTLKTWLFYNYAVGGPLLDYDTFNATIPNLPDNNIFNSTADWTSSNSPDTYSVAWGDVDGDGDLDLAVGNYDGNNEVYLNSGTALATTPAWTSSNSLGTYSVAWGDVDGDGDLDLAVGNNGNNEVYLNSGTALATTPTWTSSNSLYTNSVAWGDVDGDGDLDLAVGNYAANNEVYLNSGTALATTPTWTSSNSLDTYSVAWGDVDGDGDLDLAVGNYGVSNEVYLNSGTALATTPTWTSSNSLYTNSVAWGDVDGDGDLDLAVGNSGGNNEIYLNSGTALATTPAWTSSYSLNTRSVAWGDVDGDGDLDLAVGNYDSNNEVYLNSGTALATTPAWTSSNSLGTFSVAWGDVDGDGDLDLAVGNLNSNNEVYLNQLEGSNYTGNEWYPIDSEIGIDQTNGTLAAWINVSSMPANTGFDITGTVELYHGAVALTIKDFSIENENWSETTTDYFLIEADLDEVISIAGQSNEYCFDYVIYHSSTGNAASSGGGCTYHTPPLSNDGDWIPDSYEGAFTQSSSSLLDTDSDGWGDWIEHWGGSDPDSASSTPTDADNDGLPYLLEEMMGTSDNDYDSDGDGALDYDDFRYGGHPARASHLPPNQDWDSCWDYWEDQVGLNYSNPDSDGDGVYDCFESDPWNASSTPTDTDGDGLPDDLESLYNTDASNPDSDGDGVPDSAEIGSGSDPNNEIGYDVNYWSNYGQTLEQFGTATASSTATIYSANNVLDDDHSSYWQPENPCPGWIEIDLGNTYRPSYIEVSIFNEDYDEDYPREFVIQTRENPSDTWRNISSFTFTDDLALSGAFGGYTDLHKVRYVRIYCISSNDDSGVPHDIAFSEITIYDSTNLQYVNLSAIDSQTTGGTGPIAPTDAPSAPTHDEATVISLFSDEYTDVPGTDWSPSWSQNTIYTAEVIAGNNVIKYQNLDYMGVSLDSNQYQDVSDFTHVHFDYWTVDACPDECLKLSLISPGPLENSVSAGTIVTGSWQTVDISLNLYDVPDLSNIFQLKFEGSGTVYIDNLYFYGGDNSGTNNNTNNNTNNDADSDGVNDLFDLCPNTPAGTEVDSDGCEIVESPEPVLDVMFDERQENGVWSQDITVSISDIWLNQNYSMSLKVVDSNGNTVYSYFSPMDEDDQNGWWRFGNDMVEDPTEQYIDLNWDGLLTSGEWEGSSRFFEEKEYPFFGDGEYCVEISLGHQINRSDGPMDVIKNIFNNEVICGEFLHESMDGVVWDGNEEEGPQSTLEKVMSNKIVSSLLDFMDSTTGQIVSIGLAILGFAGKMVLARGQRAKNKRVSKFSNAIRKADTRGRLKILEMDIEKANEKGKLPRGGYGDLMEQIESRMESLGFDDDPDQGSTSGNWTSGDDMQQASEMMWDAQDMMEDAKEEAKMTRQAVEGLQDRLNIDTKYSEEAVSKGPRYERTGVRLSDSAASTGPSLPGSKEGGLEANPDLVASILSQNIAPKDKCPCGNGKMYKDCHMKRGKKKKKW